MLILSVRKILEKAIKAGGSTLKDYRKPDGSMGYFQNSHCVYDKEGHRCPNCTCDINKTKGIRRIVQGGRSTFYCETKQK
jgi:formamidopyrimidine-DNA glycosylase